MGWVDGVGVVDSRMSSGFDMTGFYWDLGWVHQSVIKPQDTRFMEVLEVVDNLGQDETGDFVGKLGSMG